MNSFSALSDPKRAQIVKILAQNGEMAAGDICNHFSISNAAVSQHLKVLKSANLVNIKIDAKRRIYSINPMGINDIENWAFDIKRQMEGTIDRLEQFLADGKDLDS